MPAALLKRKLYFAILSNCRICVEFYQLLFSKYGWWTIFLPVVQVNSILSYFTQKYWNEENKSFLLDVIYLNKYFVFFVGKQALEWWLNDSWENSQFWTFSQARILVLFFFFLLEYVYLCTWSCIAHILGGFRCDFKASNAFKEEQNFEDAVKLFMLRMV